MNMGEIIPRIRKDIYDLGVSIAEMQSEFEAKEFNSSEYEELYELLKAHLDFQHLLVEIENIHKKRTERNNERA